MYNLAAIPYGLYSPLGGGLYRVHSRPIHRGEPGCVGGASDDSSGFDFNSLALHEGCPSCRAPVFAPVQNLCGQDGQMLLGLTNTFTSTGVRAMYCLLGRSTAPTPPVLGVVGQTVPHAGLSGIRSGDPFRLRGPSGSGCHTTEFEIIHLFRTCGVEQVHSFRRVRRRELP